MSNLVPRVPGTEDKREVHRWRTDLVRYLKNMEIDAMTQSISDPPTQAEVTAIQTKLNELINLINK